MKSQEKFSTVNFLVAMRNCNAKYDNDEGGEGEGNWKRSAYYEDYE